MRPSRLLVAARFTSLGSIAVLAAACGDEQPRVPPFTENGGTGATDSTGGTGSGGKKPGGGGTGATDNEGGDGPSTAGTSGSGNGDAFAHCGDPWAGDEPPQGEVACDLDSLTVVEDPISGTISSDMTLVSGNAYYLDGPVRVAPGATLTIEPCVKIMGLDPGSLLAVQAGTISGGAPGPGGKLVAVGEPMAPIVFTSSQAPGSRQPGDWGGVIILGNARVNQATGSQRPGIEGLETQEFYGWSTDAFNAESSGAIAYVRIEYASRQINLNDETNGLTFGGVGSGTDVHHVMVSNSNDDCFEWFGGTVNAHHLIALNCDDDMFDTDFGYSGKVQFAFGRQFPTTSETDSNGFEMDTDPIGSTSIEPKTEAQWSNVTLCGTNDLTKTDRIGMVLRRAVAGSIKNALITGFGNPLERRTPLVTAIEVTHTSVFGTGDFLEDGDGKGTLEWFTGQEGNSGDSPDRFCDCWSDPPVPFSATPTPGVAAGAGFEAPEADYQGAFQEATADANWMTGAWVDWSAE